MQGALFHEVQQPHAAFLGDLNLDSGAHAPVAREKAGQDALRRLRWGADAEHAHDAPVEGAGPLPDRLRLRQDVAAVAQQVLALGGELDPTADPIEQLHPELGFQVTDLA